MRLAYFSPLPPQRSGIADYSLEILPHLSRRADVTVFVPDPGKINDPALQAYDIRNYEQFRTQHGTFDLALYHIGNSEHHDAIWQIAFEYPGVVLLHDVFLHHSVALRTVGAGKTSAYWREMGYALGAPGVRRAMRAKYGSPLPFFEVSLNNRLLDSSLGVLVHSQFAARLLRKQGYRGPLALISAPIAAREGHSRRAQLELPADAVLFGSFGLLTREKQVASILQALKTLREKMPQAHGLLVGGEMPGVPVQEIARDLHLDNVLSLIGYVPELDDFVDWLHTADVVINLRNPTVGETSATALRAMAAGKPLIVDDQGWYSEIPSSATIKIPPGDRVALLDAMRRLGESESLRRQMGESGLNHVRRVCNPEVVAGGIIDELEKLSRAVAVYG